MFWSIFSWWMNEQRLSRVMLDSGRVCVCVSVCVRLVYAHNVYSNTPVIQMMRWIVLIASIIWVREQKTTITTTNTFRLKLTWKYDDECLITCLKVWTIWTEDVYFLISKWTNKRSKKLNWFFECCFNWDFLFLVDLTEKNLPKCVYIN